MHTLNHSDHSHHFETIRSAILKASDPEDAVRRHLNFSKGTIQCAEFENQPQRIFLVAIGKAAGAMAKAAHDLLGPSIYAGVITVLGEPTGNFPPQFNIIPTGHPLPNHGSFLAARRAREILLEAGSGDLTLVLISGGGSAMFELPKPEISLGDLRAINQSLVTCGAPIQEINVVRRSISQVKAGGLARMATPTQVLALILSDVVGDQLRAIASGPTVLRRDPPQAARFILKKYGIWEATPASIREVLSRDSSKTTRTRWPKNVLIGSNRIALKAAQDAAMEMGFETRITTTQMIGEAQEIGRQMGNRLFKLSRDSTMKRPQCLLAGGETTVKLQGQGRGGRNQELTLAAAIQLQDVENVALMSFATDGIDGPTDAAGGIATGNTFQQLRQVGLDPYTHLADNDSYPILAAVDGLIRTGPTGTNVNDVVVGLLYPPA